MDDRIIIGDGLSTEIKWRLGAITKSETDSPIADPRQTRECRVEVIVSETLIAGVL
jgi:hypothetical protein